MFKEKLDFPEQSRIEQLGGGILGLHDNMSPTTRPVGLLSECRNLIRYGVTAATTRPGITKVGASVGSDPILGMASLYRTDGTKRLVAACDDKWKAYNGTSWSDIFTATPGNKIEGTMFSNHLVITNGVDPVKKYDGTSVEDLAGDPPLSPFIMSAYGRIFLVEPPHGVTFCQPFHFEEWTPTPNNDAGTIFINSEDGDQMKWVKLYKTHIYFWKRYSLHELHGPESGQLSVRWRTYQAANIGTPNGRTIAEVNGVLYWLSDSDGSKGVVRWAGGQPIPVSEPVQKTIDSINWGEIDKACATSWEGYYVLAIPTGASTSPDVTLFYNTMDQSWWKGDGWFPSVFLDYRLTDQEDVLMGDIDGDVFVIGGEDDDGTDIEYEAVIGPATFGINTKEKRVRRAYAAVSLEPEEVI